MQTKESKNDPRRAYEREKLPAEALAARVAEARAELRGHLDPGAPGAGPLAARVEALGAWLLPLYARADLLAMRYQARYRRASIAIYCLSATAVTLAAASYLFPPLHGLAFLEVVAIGAVLALIRWGNRVGWHRRWLDYRTLAEYLRTALFTALLPEVPAQASPRGSWVDEALAEALRGSPEVPALPASSLPAARSFLGAAWVEDQRRFHEGKRKRELRRHERVSRWGEAFFWATLGAALLHLGVHSDGALRGLTFLTVALPAWGAALAALRAHFEHKRIAERCGATAGDLASLAGELERAEDLPGLARVVSAAEAVMLREHADWHATVRLHHLEPPA